MRGKSGTDAVPHFFWRGGRLAEPCFLSNTESGGAPSFAHVAKGGNHTGGAMGFGLNGGRHASMTNPMAATASCPTLAKSARMGRPRYR